MLKIDVEKTADVAVVRCIGRLIRGEAVHTLRNAIVSEKNTQTILLDLSEIEALDAGGVNALVSLRHWAVNRGIRVKLVDPSPFVCEMLTRFRLDRVFEISSPRDALVVLAGRECGFLADSRLPESRTAAYSSTIQSHGASRAWTYTDPSLAPLTLNPVGSVNSVADLIPSSTSDTLRINWCG
jgi:anti-anti-sigma factor